MSLDITIINSIEALEQFVPEWLAFLEAQPLGMSVYNHPKYLLAHFRHNPEGSRNLRLAIVAVREQGQIVCIAPLSIQEQQFRLELSVKRLFPVHIRKITCPGNSFIFTNEPQKVFGWFSAVFETLKDKKIRFDLLVIYGLRNNSPFWDYCMTRLKGKPFRLYNVLAEAQCDQRVHLSVSMEVMFASIEGQWRKSVRRNLKIFHQSVKEFRLERITEASQVEIFFDIMMKVSANSWQGKTFGLTDWKTEARLKCWKEIADYGLLRSYILWADNQPIAYILAYQYNDVFFGQNVGYNLSAAKLAPGIVCLYYCLDDMMTHQPAQTYDFDFGTHSYKKIFANEEFESTIVFVAGSAKGRLLAFLQTFLNQFVHRTKRTLQKWGLTDRIRKLLKNKK